MIPPQTCGISTVCVLAGTCDDGLRSARVRSRVAWSSKSQSRSTLHVFLTRWHLISADLISSHHLPQPRRISRDVLSETSDSHDTRAAVIWWWVGPPSHGPQCLAIYVDLGGPGLGILQQARLDIKLTPFLHPAIASVNRPPPRPRSQSAGPIYHSWSSQCNGQCQC